jgi:hypothetical protein
MVEIFNKPINGTITIWEGNQSAVAYSQNTLVIEKTKQKWHVIKDHVEHETIKLRCLPTDQMVANMFTKPLP